jgi:outer membrane protein assembly factor BamE (lipoprotein component of BamABCDE complex)
MKRFLAPLVLLALLAGGCVTMGRDFPTDPVKSIVNGKTTREDVRNAFGQPYQTGIEDGMESWTYYKIKYRGPKESKSKELHITFDKKGVVDSHSFTSTEPPR